MLMSFLWLPPQRPLKGEKPSPSHLIPSRFSALEEKLSNYLFLSEVAPIFGSVCLVSVDVQARAHHATFLPESLTKSVTAHTRKGCSAQCRTCGFGPWLKASRSLCHDLKRQEHAYTSHVKKSNSVKNSDKSRSQNLELWRP